jgi:putative transposase
VPDRRCADAIFDVLRTGCPWQALYDTELCAHSTAHDRFQAWGKVGVFLRLWQVGGEQFDELQGLDWDWLRMDGAMTKAPLSGKNRTQSN